MDHEGARRLMAEAIEGRLSADDERELALHLVECAECKTVYEGLQHANPALGSIQLGEPSTEAIDAAVHRAATVLQGEADPGPMGPSDEPPALPEDLERETVRIDSGGPPTAETELRVPPPVAAPPAPGGPSHVPPEAHVRAIEMAEQEPVTDDPAEPPPSGPSTGEPGPLLDDPSEAEDAPVAVPEVPVVVPPDQAPFAPDQAAVEPRDEVDTLLDADRTRFEPLAYDEEPDDGEGIGPGLWLVAIAISVVLAVLAGFLIFRGQGLFGGGGGDLPSADEVRSRVDRTFTDMKSLKASFDIQRLGLFRMGREDDSLRYSFSTGRFTGSIDYDRAEGYKQDFTLNVRDEEVTRAEVVQRAAETRSLLGSGADRTFVVESNPPLGPPDGALRPTLGLLEDTLGSAAALIADADDIEVVRTVERDGRSLYEVRMPVEADPLTRADRLEVHLDATSFIPVIVKRSIARENARVLGPASALSDDALDTAFGDNERITTELLELTNVQYDEIVLPGDLQLTAPEGVEEQSRNSGYERLTRAEIGERLDHSPLLPRSLPDGYEEQQLAAFAGEPAGWGPGGAYPAPQSIFQSQYFDGRSTIVVTQRQMEQRFELQGSPLQRAGIQMTTAPLDADGQSFFAGTSPEVPPHVYGFLGNTFVVVSGYAPLDELLAVATSLQETPVDVQPPVTSPTPAPGSTPGPAAPVDGTPSPGPAATATP